MEARIAQRWAVPGRMNRNRTTNMQLQKKGTTLKSIGTALKSVPGWVPVAAFVIILSLGTGVALAQAAPAGPAQPAPAAPPSAPAAQAPYLAPPAMPVAKAVPADPLPPADPRAFTAASPTLETVNAFLNQVWGYDSDRLWRVMAIQPTDAPNVTKVIVFIIGKSADAKPQAVDHVRHPGRQSHHSGVYPCTLRRNSVRRHTGYAQSKGHWSRSRRCGQGPDAGGVRRSAVPVLQGGPGHDGPDRQGLSRRPRRLPAIPAGRYSSLLLQGRGLRCLRPEAVGRGLLQVRRGRLRHPGSAGAGYGRHPAAGRGPARRTGRPRHRRLRRNPGDQEHRQRRHQTGHRTPASIRRPRWWSTAARSRSTFPTTRSSRSSSSRPSWTGLPPGPPPIFWPPQQRRRLLRPR